MASPAAACYRVNFSSVVELGRYCVVACRDGRVMGSAGGGLRVEPFISRDPDLDAAGRAVLVFRTTMARVSMFDPRFPTPAVRTRPQALGLSGGRLLIFGDLLTLVIP